MPKMDPQILRDQIFFNQAVHKFILIITKLEIKFQVIWTSVGFMEEQVKIV